MSSFAKLFILFLVAFCVGFICAKELKQQKSVNQGEVTQEWVMSEKTQD
jgi:hypothetical protein